MADVHRSHRPDLRAEVLQSDKPAIIDFWAEWCGPCRQIAPIIKELAAEYGDRVKIVKMDVDASPETPGPLRRPRDPHHPRLQGRPGGAADPGRAAEGRLREDGRRAARVARARRRQGAGARGGSKKRTGQLRRTASR